MGLLPRLYRSLLHLARTIDNSPLLRSALFARPSRYYDRTTLKWRDMRKVEETSFKPSSSSPSSSSSSSSPLSSSTSSMARSGRAKRSEFELERLFNERVLRSTQGAQFWVPSSSSSLDSGPSVCEIVRDSFANHETSMAVDGGGGKVGKEPGKYELDRLLVNDLCLYAISQLSYLRELERDAQREEREEKERREREDCYLGSNFENNNDLGGDMHDSVKNVKEKEMKKEKQKEKESEKERKKRKKKEEEVIARRQQRRWEESFQQELKRTRSRDTMIKERGKEEDGVVDGKGKENRDGRAWKRVSSFSEVESGSLLIAHPTLVQDTLSRSVILLLEHDYPPPSSSLESQLRSPLKENDKRKGRREEVHIKEEEGTGKGEGEGKESGEGEEEGKEEGEEEEEEEESFSGMSLGLVLNHPLPLTLGEAFDLKGAAPAALPFRHNQVFWIFFFLVHGRW